MTKNPELRECRKCENLFTVPRESTETRCSLHRVCIDQPVKQPKNKGVYRPRYNGIKYYEREGL